jgi:hypothetical protein
LPGPGRLSAALLDAHGALDVVTGAQPVLANLGGAEGDVVVGAEVTRRPDKTVAVRDVNDTGYRLRYCGFCDSGFFDSGFFRDCGHGVLSRWGKFAQPKKKRRRKGLAGLY